MAAQSVSTGANIACGHRIYWPTVSHTKPRHIQDLRGDSSIGTSGIVPGHRNENDRHIRTSRIISPPQRDALPETSVRLGTSPAHRGRIRQSLRNMAYQGPSDNASAPPQFFEASPAIFAARITMQQMEAEATAIVDFVTSVTSVADYTNARIHEFCLFQKGSTVITQWSGM